MKSIFNFICISITLLCASCSSNSDNVDSIPFSDYTLSTDFVWKISETNKIIEINSPNELHQYSEGTPFIIHHNVDFEKYSLLVAKVASNSGIQYLSKNLKKDDNNNYTLNVNITQNMATVAETRVIAIQVDKLPKTKTTKLNLIFRH